MPIDHYRRQVERQPIGLELFRACAGRYGVSLTAAILKWLELTPRRAILVMVWDGFIDWALSSEPALRTGRFSRIRGVPSIALPAASLAASSITAGADAGGLELPAGVWFIDEPVTTSPSSVTASM